MIDFEGPPSSPFVTEVDNNSRSPSKQWRPAMADEIKEEEIVISPLKSSVHNLEGNKENVWQDDEATLAKMFASPKKPSTPDQTAGQTARLGSSQSSNMMPPPPSTRKSSSSPKKTPRRRSGANTPRSISRGNSSNGMPEQNAAAIFQAGLDVRNAMMPAEDQVTMDDTCFSTFSEVPDMTVFAKLGQNSPTKRSDVLRHSTQQCRSRTWYVTQEITLLTLAVAHA